MPSIFYRLSLLQPTHFKTASRIAINVHKHTESITAIHPNPHQKSHMKSACPFASNCRNGDFLLAFCETMKPCSDHFNTCHIFQAKSALYKAEKNGQPKETPQPSEAVAQ